MTQSAPTNKLAGGVVHELSEFIEVELISQKELATIWESLTPIARNEWICWINSAKKDPTKVKRLRQMSENLLEGKRRPCCWPGCPHRK